MTTLPPIRLRLGALALAASALLFAVFPLVRPFFRLDVRSPTLAEAASGPLASPAWLVAHLLLLMAFALLPVGLLALGAALLDGPAGPRARHGLALALAGVGLVTPAVGVEVFAMPVLGRLYLDGVTGVAPAFAWIYRGPMTLLMIAGLLLLTLGVLGLARAGGRPSGLPRGGVIALAIGLAAWLPLLPRPVRIVDGLVIGAAGGWLAWGIWRQAGRRAADGALAPTAPRVERAGP